MAASPPLLKESQIKPLATEQSFERGENYYLNGAIFNPMRQGNTLWADCDGDHSHSMLRGSRSGLKKPGFCTTS